MSCELSIYSQYFKNILGSDKTTTSSSKIIHVNDVQKVHDNLEDHGRIKECELVKVISISGKNFFKNWYAFKKHENGSYQR